MAQFEFTVTDPMGLHARPAGMIVKEAKKYAARVTLSANGKECEATRLMALMAMGIKCGTSVTVRVEGDDAQNCAAELQRFLLDNL